MPIYQYLPFYIPDGLNVEGSPVLVKKNRLRINSQPTVLNGGDGRDRTDGLYVANVPLSQLSYIPSLCSMSGNTIVKRAPLPVFCA